MPLTDTQIKALRGREKPTKYSDGGGLHLLVTSKGSKLWRLAYRFGGKQKPVAINFIASEARLSQYGAN